MRHRERGTGPIAICSMVGCNPAFARMRPAVAARRRRRPGTARERSIKIGLGLAWDHLGIGLGSPNSWIPLGPKVELSWN